MSKVIRRAIVPLLLLLAAAAAIQYGAAHHSVPVLVEEQEEVTIDVPNPFVPPGFGLDPNSSPPGMPPFGPQGFGDPSFGSPPFGPGPFGASPIKEVVTRSIQTAKDLPEPALIRDVTVGGVVRLASGQLKRTYSGDQGPSLCPT